MSIERLARELEEMRARVARLEAALRTEQQQHAESMNERLEAQSEVTRLTEALAAAERVIAERNERVDYLGAVWGHLRAIHDDLKARLDSVLPDDSDPDTLPGVGGQRSETPLLDALGDAIFGDEKG